jgi:hypothetical protein
MRGRKFSFLLVVLTFGDPPNVASPSRAMPRKSVHAPIGKGDLGSAWMWFEHFDQQLQFPQIGSE